MSKYQSYPEYKESGIHFLGKVPKDWVVGRFKFCSERVVVGIAEAATHAYADKGVPIIRSTNIREKGLDSNGLFFIKNTFADQNESKYLYENDIITVRTGFPGISSVVPASLNKSQCFTNLISTPRKEFSSKFLTYFLNSASGKAYFDLLGWGSAQKNISVPILQDFPLAYPELKVQEVVSNFLDHETAKIDTLIEKQQQLIKLLKEKRQAVISHAVTKGISYEGKPEAPMKDSGVEWLGKIPEHWIVARYKYCTTRVIVGIAEAATHAYSDLGTPLVRSTNIKEDGLRTSDLLYLKDSFAEQNESKYLLENDVVTVRTGYPGISAVVPKELNKSHCFTNLISTPKERFCPHFLSEYLNSDMGKAYFALQGWGSAQKNISVPILQEFPIAYPPYQEQKFIAEYIAKQRIKFKALLERSELSIKLMNERRTALISAAVTGKIDVRNWKKALVNEEEVA